MAYSENKTISEKFHQLFSDISNVVINQPMPQPQHQPPAVPLVIQQTISGPAKVPMGHKPWSTNLCDCFQDIPSCKFS